MTQQPLAYRKLLAELFADAEAHGLGYLEVGFRAHPGQQDAAADYIGSRAEWAAVKAVERGASRREPPSHPQGDRAARPARRRR